MWLASSMRRTRSRTGRRCTARTYSAERAAVAQPEPPVRPDHARRRRRCTTATRRGTSAGRSRTAHSRAAGAPGRSAGPRAASSAAPKSSWLNQLPHRPIACATAMPGSDGVGERRQQDAPAAAADPGADAAERDRAPDAEAAVPDLERVERLPPAPKYSCVLGDDVVEPPADDAERHRPDRDVGDQARRARRAPRQRGRRARPRRRCPAMMHRA